jgi:uncharacterized membrane protein YbhN (UPF0104 family)
MKRKFLAISKVVFGLALLYLVFTHVNLRDIWGYIKIIPPHLLLLALAFAAMGQVAGAFRMRYILHESGISLERMFSIKLTYVGGFFNVLLPGGVGGDAIKIYFLRKKTDFRVLHLVKLLVADRASGLYFMCIIGFALLLLIRPYNDWPWLEPLTYGGFAAATAIYFLMNHYALKVHYKVCLNAVMYSLVVQFFWVGALIILWEGIGGKTHMFEYIFLYVIASIAATIPISVGGLGLREFAFLFGAKFLHDHADLAVNAELGVALSLALYALTILSVLPGIIFWKKVKDAKI